MDGPKPPAAGWYANEQGFMQWWSGTAWGPISTSSVVMKPLKDTGIAYLLMLLLLPLAGHRFYLGRYKTAFIFLGINLAMSLLLGYSLLQPGTFQESELAQATPFLLWLNLGFTVFPLGAIWYGLMGVWLLLDLFFMPMLVSDENKKIAFFNTKHIGLSKPPASTRRAGE